MSNDDTPSLYKMGANRDRVYAMRKEMEQAIESASDSLHDSTSWWDDYYAFCHDGKTPIEALLDRLERIAASYARELI